MSKHEDLVRYLLDASAVSLGAYELARLNQAANARREVRELLDEWIEQMALAYLVTMLRHKIFTGPQRGDGEGAGPTRGTDPELPSGARDRGRPR